MQWTGTTCSMCATINGLYGLKYFRNFCLKNKLEDNIDDYIERMKLCLDIEPVFIESFYQIDSINMFSFFKKIFKDFDDKKIIISNKEIHEFYFNLCSNNKEFFYTNHENEILLNFYHLYYIILEDVKKENNLIHYCLDLKEYKIKNFNEYIKSYFKKNEELLAIDKILYFRIFKKNTIDINLFKEIQFDESIDIEKLANCNKFLEKNKHLKGKLKYKLKAIIIHCGSDSLEGDFGCFRKDDNEDKYWYFQMNETPKKYSLQEIIDKNTFSGYNTVNEIDLLYEQDDNL